MLAHMQILTLIHSFPLNRGTQSTPRKQNLEGRSRRLNGTHPLGQLLTPKITTTFTSCSDHGSNRQLLCGDALAQSRVIQGFLVDSGIRRRSRSNRTASCADVRAGQAQRALAAARSETAQRRSEINTFQPANESPARRHAASSQRITCTRSRSLSKLPALVARSPDAAAHVAGPGQNFHSAPAW